MKFDVRVGEVMNRTVRTVSPEETIENAARIMREENIGSVVVAGGKQVKGIVTTSDIVYKHVAGKQGEKVSDIMTAEVIAISPDKTIEDAASLMVEKDVEKLLVFDMNMLTGIITANDILRIEPSLFRILLDMVKSGRKGIHEEEFEFVECEVCGNYTDDVEEVSGVYTCQECRS